MAAFFQDDWKVSPRLTLNLGLRYDIFFGTTFPDGRRLELPARLQPDRRQRRGSRRSGPTDGSDCGCEQNFHNFGPRVGLRLPAHGQDRAALRLRDHLCAGRLLHAPVARAGSTNRPISSSTALPRSTASTRSVILQDGFPAGAVARHRGARSGRGRHQRAAANMPDQYSEQWFFDVQRELPYDILMTVGYTGNGAHKLIVPLNYNLPYGPAAVDRRLAPHLPVLHGRHAADADGQLFVQRPDLESGKTLQQRVSAFSPRSPGRTPSTTCLRSATHGG